MDKKRSLDFAEADSACFLRMRSPKSFFDGGGGGHFFLTFLRTFETHGCFNFSCKFSWRTRFPDKAFSFSTVKSLFLHLVLLNVCKIKYILDIQTEAPRSTRLVPLQSFSNTELILDMWFCNLFNVSVRQSVGYIWTKPLRPFVVILPSYPNPSCVFCSWFLGDLWLLPTFFHFHVA